MMDKFTRLVARIARGIACLIFSPYTVSAMEFDVVRFLTRAKSYFQKDIVPTREKLHVGCGSRKVPGWLNIDVWFSDHDVDLAKGSLPWISDAFDVVVSQHVIEHLDLLTESMPLLRELHRVLKPGGEIWLSCPDIAKICNSYIEHKMEDLLADRRTRIPDFSLGDTPTNHLINELFYHKGTHKNLYDLTLLQWALEETGFERVERIVEADLLKRFPEFPPRHDDKQSIYVRAVNR